jgi:hypothetical protein
MKDDVLRILKMVEEGKISSEKGVELIEAVRGEKLLPEKYVPKVSNDEMMLKVKVISAANDNVNVQLPIKFIKGVLAACGKIPVNVNGMESIDTKMLMEAIDSGLTGKIVDVKSANGDLVEVVIE